MKRRREGRQLGREDSISRAFVSFRQGGGEKGYINEDAEWVMENIGVYSMDRNQCGRGITEEYEGQEGGAVHDRPKEGFGTYCAMMYGRGRYKGQGSGMWER